MAPPSKGQRVELTVRLPKHVREALGELAVQHGASANDEIVAAVLRHLADHDPARCANAWCAGMRAGQKP